MDGDNTVVLETNTRQYHVVTGNTTKTILKHMRRLNTRMALGRELTKTVGHETMATRYTEQEGTGGS